MWGIVEELGGVVFRVPTALRNVLGAGVRFKFEGRTKLLLLKQNMATAALNAETTPNRKEHTCDLPTAM